MHAKIKSLRKGYRYNLSFKRTSSVRGRQQQDAGSKKEFESEEVKNFVEDMYKTGLTQENSVYDLSLLGDTNNNTGATDFSNMSDEEILKAFEEKQNSENADNKDNTETLSDTKTETTENTTDKTDKVAG